MVDHNLLHHHNVESSFVEDITALNPKKDEINFEENNLEAKMYLATVLFFAAIVSEGTDAASHASIKSKYGQLVTSSTLRWHHVSRDGMRSQPIPEEAVASGTGNPDRVVCRAEHHGALLTGQTVPGGSCAVGFVNKMYK